MTLGPVGDDDLERFEHAHAAQRVGVVVAPDEELQQLDVVDAVGLGDADVVDELADGLGGIAAGAHAPEGGHAGVVPAVDGALLDQPTEDPLGHDRVGQGEPGELGLLGLAVGQLEVFQAPVVQRPVVGELQGAQRVGDALDGVGLPVGPVVGGVDHPVVAGAVVLDPADAVQHGVTHRHDVVLHVDAGAQHLRPVVELAGPHATQQVEVLLGAAVAVGGLDARLAEAAALLGDRLGVLVVDVGQALGDQLLRPGVQLLEVVRGVDDAGRLEPEPRDVVLDGVDVLGVLGLGVGVVEPQVAGAAELLRQPEVELDGLGVADVEVAVGLRGEPRLDATVVEPGLLVGLDPLADEVGSGGRGVVRSSGHGTRR